MRPQYFLVAAITPVTIKSSQPEYISSAKSLHEDITISYPEAALRFENFTEFKEGIYVHGMTSISNTNPTRAGLKLHRENFAEFKEGVLGRMESKAETTAKVIMMEE